MGTPRFTPEFKEKAVRQITERGYSVAEVSDRPGVSAHSLYKWLRAIKPDNSGHRTVCDVSATQVLHNIRLSTGDLSSIT